jgi:hypothetical protein
MATFLELYKEIKRIEKEAKTAKHVHKLRKQKIWLRISKTRLKQDGLMSEGHNVESVLRFVEQEWDDCFKKLENEYSRYRDERKKRAKEYEDKLRQLNDIVNELSTR